jgi:hypothetical protein
MGKGKKRIPKEQKQEPEEENVSDTRDEGKGKCKVAPVLF